MLLNFVLLFFTLIYVTVRNPWISMLFFLRNKYSNQGFRNCVFFFLPVAILPLPDSFLKGGGTPKPSNPRISSLEKWFKNGKNLAEWNQIQSIIPMPHHSSYNLLKFHSLLMSPANLGYPLTKDLIWTLSGRRIEPKLTLPTYWKEVSVVTKFVDQNRWERGNKSLL